MIADLLLFMLLFASSRSVTFNAAIAAILITIVNEDIQILLHSIKIRAGGSVSNFAIKNWSILVRYS